ncbi:hypothetical protein EYF80_043296 [Liparis tanakae]|uniref:Uncharacterized protein n=1 Tax=Liparis tanakae TaxID=230148 RepID=A0A4Z2FYV2_9TELE|nr:hypothetical protein EYF80_043296 [Liparis tanakae]
MDCSQSDVALIFNQSSVSRLKDPRLLDPSIPHSQPNRGRINTTTTSDPPASAAELWSKYRNRKITRYTHAHGGVRGGYGPAGRASMLHYVTHRADDQDAALLLSGEVIVREFRRRIACTRTLSRPPSGAAVSD